MNVVEIPFIIFLNNQNKEFSRTNTFLSVLRSIKR